MTITVIFCSVCGFSPKHDYVKLPKYIRCKDCKKNIHNYEYISVGRKENKEVNNHI